MFKTIKYGWLALKIAWAANRFNFLLSVIGKIYSSTIFPFIQILLLSKLLDLISSGQQLTFSKISWLIIVYLVASLVRLLLENFLQTKDLIYQFNFNDYLELQFNRKINSLDPAVFERPEFQNLIVQMTDVKHSIDGFLERFVGVIDSTFKVATATVILLPRFPIFIPVILLATIPSFFSLNRFRKRIYPFLYEKRSLLGRSFEYIKRLLSQDSTSKEVAIFKNGTHLIAKLSNLSRNFFNGFTRAQNETVYQILAADVFQFVAFVGTQAMNLAAVMAEKLTIGQFSLYFQQTQALASGAEMLLDHYSASSMRVRYLEKYEEFINYPRAVYSPKQPEQIVSDPTPPVIEFKNVTFRYPNTERIILQNFNMCIASGEKIALVGENGAGKTTIIKLILRFYDVDEGEVLINGANIKNINLDEWYKQLGALFQDFVKYQFTLKENVYFGDLTKGDSTKLLDEALQKSGADSYIENLPNKAGQVLGKMFEGGIDLSGGQWQKLALARAFYRNAPILILDEPTSAIDAKAEYEIFERVQKLQSDKTVIIISHRFSTVRNADRILVLDAGRIIEEGHHTALIKKKGLYAELFNLQAKGYK
jgi:ATP-binding cassette, subfamily B, bacterial